jgi:hypothetical protein
MRAVVDGGVMTFEMAARLSGAIVLLDFVAQRHTRRNATSNLDILPVNSQSQLKAAVFDNQGS